MSEKEDCDHSTCNCFSATTSVCQTLSEMDWERGIWYAALIGDKESIEKLIKKSGNPRAVARSIDNAGYTALHYAARNGHIDICQLLLKNDAHIDAPTRSAKATPLHKAATSGQTEIVKLLIKYGACVQKQDVDGKTALHRAVENKHLNIADILIEACQELKGIKDSKGKTATDDLPIINDL